ncbi:hypothetical protein DW736_05340 [Coprobacillus sp. AM28-15LB]|uniref:Uncharacterized protein n=1 Tax=Blautia intestinihominis TaxID=3133152 RepID=A0ABV1AIP6_9FIRM|nr:hypothetical protein DW736_05340 [Coprobacillus sp. AM28-15LB]
MADTRRTAGSSIKPFRRSLQSGDERYRNTFGCIDGNCKIYGRRKSGGVPGWTALCDRRYLSGRTG